MGLLPHLVHDVRHGARVTSGTCRLMQPRVDVPDAHDLLRVLLHRPAWQEDAACRERRIHPYLFRPGGAFPAGFRSGADDDGGAGNADASGVGAGGGAGSGDGSFSTAGPLAAEVRGVVTAGAATDGGATVAAVVGTGLAFDCALGQSMSRTRTVMDPKPTSSAATNASGSQTLRLPIR
jgi:hypothetical protein